MKRFVLSLVLVIFASVSGVLMSLNPATATALESHRYVALGDSVAAGLGLTPATGNESQLCGRSVEAYPYQVSAILEIPMEHYACSGAKVDEGIYGEQEVDGAELTPQLDRAFAAGAPDLMSVTVGANDARWSQFVRDCYTWNCGSAWDEARITAYLLDLRWELYLTLEKIEALSGNNPPHVIFTGYFIPLSANTLACEDMRNFTPAEVVWLNTQAQKLNQVIEDATSWYGFATYAPVDFNGHELCSADPWIQGIRGAAPFHPNAAGQSAFARAVIAADQ